MVAFFMDALSVRWDATNIAALVQIAGAGKRPVLCCRDFKLGARHSTLQAQVDLEHPDVSVRICSLRMRCINSIPAIVIAAVVKPLKPSIVAIRCFTPRWSCSIRLFKYFDDRSFVSAGSKPSAFSSRTAR